MPKDHKTLGFTAVEMLLVILVLLVLGAAGYIIFNHATKNAKNAPPAGWLAYTSTHSSIQFFYPKAWRLKRMPLDGKPSYYLEEVSLTGPNNFALHFTLEKAHRLPNQNWLCQAPPRQTDVAINTRYKMVLTDRGGVSLIAADPKGSIPDDPECGSLINVLTPNTLFSFWGGYTMTATPPAWSTEVLANQPEVQTAKTIFSSLKP